MKLAGEIPWLEYLTGNFDEKGWGILQENTPKEIREEYEEHKKTARNLFIDI